MHNKAPNAQGNKITREIRPKGANSDPRDDKFSTLAIFNLVIFNKRASVPSFLALFA